MTANGPRNSAPRALQAGPLRRLESWLWSGPLAHLLGGGLEFGLALARHLRGRARDRSASLRR